MEALTLSFNLHSLSEYAWLDRRPLSSEAPHELIGAPLERLLGFLDALDCPATLFVPARDLAYPLTETLKQAADRGHELGTMGYAPRPAYGYQPAGTILKDLKRAKLSFRDEMGMVPLGFRASDTGITDALIQELPSAGFTYDATGVRSLRHEIRAAWRDRRPPSASIVSGPRGPFRMQSAWRAGAGRIIEIPHQPVDGRGRGYRSGAKIHSLSFELIDFAEEGDSAMLSGFVARRPWLREPADERVRKLQTWLRPLTDAKPAMTLESLARHY